MSTISIRDATASDAAQVAVLLGDLGYPASVSEAEAHVARFTDDERSRLQVAHASDGNLVGFIATHLVPRMDADRLSCRITDLVVAQPARRMGVGTALLKAAEREALRNNAARLDLNSGDWRTEAHAFYTSHGFLSHASSFTKRLGPLHGT